MARVAGKNVIHSTGDEKTFVTGIYNYIMSSSNGLNKLGANITCNTTPDAQFNGSVEVPTFVFTVRATNVADENLVFILARSTGISNATNIYTMTVKINDEIKVNAVSIYFAENAVAIDTEISRDFFIGYYISTGYIYLYFGGYTASSLSDSSVSLSSILDESNTRYCGTINSSNIENANYYRLGQPTIEYTIPNLFDYESEPGYIEYITHKSFINSNKEQARTDSGIVSCSTVSQGRTLVIDVGNMFAVDSHTLLSID